MNQRIKKPHREPQKRIRKEKWEDVRPNLYKVFADAGIHSCELQYDGCTGTLYKTFAHSLRRVKIDMFKGREHAQKMREVIWACQYCHSKLDSLPPEATYAIVRDIIRHRVRDVKNEY